MKRAFDKKVRPREFHEGDLVMKKILSVQKDHRGKWMPNCEGELSLPLNSNTVRKFYA